MERSTTNLKLQATRGILWSTVDKFAGRFGQFIIGIILARLLLPEDFGLIGMLTVFLAFSKSFIDSGMGSGLIQKKDRTDVDFSTVFVFNLVISFSFYFLLFLSAPYIAEFYNRPELVNLTRVLGLIIVINSFAVVQRARLTIKIDFKTYAKVNVTSVVIGGLFGVLFAYLDYGVWALVIQHLSGAFVTVALLWHFNKWKPSMEFSRDSFRNLFGFGSKLLVASLYAQAFRNVYDISIGKFYSASQLGYYTRAIGFAELSSGTISSILQQVTFPILASLQDDKHRMVSAYRRLIKMSSFFIFPSMTLLALLSEPIIILLLGEKWRPVIVLLQWMCFARVFYPISTMNMNILNASGRSDLFLKIDLSKLPLLIISLIITVPIGVEAIVIGHVVTSFLSFFINAYLPGKLYGYGAVSQLRDMLPVFLSTFIMAGAVFLLTLTVKNQYLEIALGGMTGLGVFWLMSYFLKMDELKEIEGLFKNLLKRKL
ncbi:lipopolysaccharide biosynthesis protein [Salinimicrobium sp. CDJ15-81-2]|nr:lipopolysaccharide biosynthesis protein [Salinimicrobium nanhaiense]